MPDLDSFILSQLTPHIHFDFTHRPKMYVLFPVTSEKCLFADQLACGRWLFLLIALVICRWTSSPVICASL